MIKIFIAASALLASACMTTSPSRSGDDDALRLAAIAAAAGDPTRIAEHRQRDASRKPDQVLAFAGIGPGDKVADLAAGSGYYTALLSRLVGEGGAVYAVDPVRIFEAFPNARNTFPKYLESDPRSNVTYSVQKFDELKFSEPLDAVIMGLYYHDTIWTGADRAAMNAAIYEALKPGGVYLVIDHRAADDAGEEATQALHRMIGGIVKPEVTDAGFIFAGESDVLANPEDDRTASVFAEGVRGKTDRFVYAFKKPY